MLEIIVKDFWWLGKWIWRSITQRGLGEGAWCEVLLINTSLIMQSIHAGKSHDEIITRFANTQPSLRMRSFFITIIDDAFVHRGMTPENYTLMRSQRVRADFIRFRYDSSRACTINARGFV